MSTSINIDVDVWKEVKSAAEQMGISASAFVELALRHFLRCAELRDEIRALVNLLQSVNRPLINNQTSVASPPPSSSPPAADSSPAGGGAPIVNNEWVRVLRQRG